MKKTLLLFWAAFAPFFAQAQISTFGTSFIDFELHGGVTLNNIHSGDFKKIDIGTLKEKVGYNYGAGFTFHFTKFLSWRNEFNIDSKGVLMSLKATVDTLNQQAQEYLNVKQRLDYFNIPTILRLGLGKKKFRLYADVGVYLGLLWGAREEIYNTITDTKNISKNLLAFTQIDWGILGDIGGTYHINKTFAIDLKVRYNHGLQNIETGTPVYENAKNTSWLILLGGVAKF